MQFMKNTILFDLDGTLTDPKTGITKSVQYALKKFKIKAENLEDLVRFIGPPLKESFKEFYSFSEGEALNAIDFYREYFSEYGLYENRVYEGIPELLQLLKGKGFTLAVATSKPTPFAESILRHFNLDQYFTEITGSNLDNTGTAKKEIISLALKLLNKNPGDSVMVGDRKHDVIGARDNSVTSVGVLYGYGDLEEMEREGCQYIAEDIPALEKILIRLSS